MININICILLRKYPIEMQICLQLPQVVQFRGYIKVTFNQSVSLILSLDITHSCLDIRLFTR